MIACENTSCPWWDEDGCLFCEEWEEGEYMNKPEEEEEDIPMEYFENGGI